ncbi:MAG: hypothetical protein RBT13_07755 [Bacteroidales bacterium]|jgi:hypothetical protein|nr:hypothetical protein [Bacteroidales bacterium]
MKKYFLILSLLFIANYSIASNKDSVRYYAILNFFIDNVTLINSYTFHDGFWKYEPECLYLDSNKREIIPYNDILDELYIKSNSYREMSLLEYRAIMIKEFYNLYPNKTPKYFEYFFYKEMCNYLNIRLKRDTKKIDENKIWNIYMSTCYENFIQVNLVFGDKSTQKFMDIYLFTFLFEENENKITKVFINHFFR